MRSCRHQAAIGRAVAPADNQRLQRHLEECAHCRNDRQADARLAVLARELPAAPPDPHRLASIRASLLADPLLRRRAPMRWPKWVAYGIATACAASVAAAVSMRVLEYVRHSGKTAPAPALSDPARKVATRPQPRIAPAPTPTPTILPAAPLPATATHRRMASVAPPPPAAPVHQRAPTPAQIAFAQGWEAMRAGNDADAVVALELAARLAGQETIAEDARYWRAIALARLGRESARAAMEGYLGRHGGAPRAREISAMLGWLLIDRGDCAGAEARFRAAAVDATPAVRDSASAGLAALARCRRR
jgi:hypothetical protein